MISNSTYTWNMAVCAIVASIATESSEIYDGRFLRSIEPQGGPQDLFTARVVTDFPSVTGLRDQYVAPLCCSINFLSQSNLWPPLAGDRAVKNNLIDPSLFLALYQHLGTFILGYASKLPLQIIHTN
jgi:hypothetical protein